MARAVIGALRVVLGLDSAEFTRGLNNASRQTRGFAAASKSMQGAADALTGSIRGIGGALGVLSVGAAGKAFLDLATKSAQMTTSLKLATAEFGRFFQAQQDVERIAAVTRSGLQESAKLYGNFVRAVKDVGGSQQDAARATETFSKALKIGGAGQEEAASATLQFSQALASGVLRGDEFNSIMEASPRIAKLLADSLGVPIGALRDMAAEGDLTADKLLKALTDTKFTEGIDAEFKQLPVTFGEAMGQVENAAITTFGAFDRGGRFSEAFANFILGGSDGLSDLAARAEQAGIEIRASFEGLRDAFAPLLAGAMSAFGGIEQGANYARDAIANILGAIDQVWNSVARLGNAANSVERWVTGRTTIDDLPTSDMRGRFLGAYSRSSTKLTLDSIMRGNPLRDFNAASVVSKGVKRPPEEKKSGVKAAKAKKPKDDPLANAQQESYYDWLGDLRDDASNPIDFSAIERSVDLGLDSLVEQFRKASKDGSESMVNLANNSLNALNNLAQSIKGGGFLDILSSVFNAFGSLSKMGLFGGGLKAAFGDFTGIAGFRANGGLVDRNRTYVVGERGPELFTPSQSGYITPNGSNDNGGPTRVHIVPSAYFDAIVDQRATNVAAPLAARAGVAGSADAQRTMARRSSRRIP